MTIYFDPKISKVVEKLPGGKRRYLAPWKALEIAGQLMFCAQQYSNDLANKIANREAVPEPLDTQ